MSWSLKCTWCTYGVTVGVKYKIIEISHGKKKIKKKNKKFCHDEIENSVKINKLSQTVHSLKNTIDALYV
jgi:hypothetical protein